MADAAAQKREARRRRILENSENRLKRITGLYSSDGTEWSTVTSEGSITCKKSFPILPSISDGAVVKETKNITNVSPYIESSPSENVLSVDKSTWIKENSPIGSPLISSEFLSESKSSQIYNLCQKTRLHIVALAVLVRLLLTSPFAVLFGESAVIPLFTTEFAEWILTKLHASETEDSPQGLLGMAMMLSGISPKKVAQLLGIFSIFNLIIRDLCIYFFVFSIIHVLLHVFSYSEIK